MYSPFKRIRLLYIVLATLLVVGLLPITLAGYLLSGRSADELRSLEGRLQAQIVQGKARQIELYGQRYRDVVAGLASAFELAGGVRALSEDGSDKRLRKTLQEDPNLFALAIMPVYGEPHIAFQPDIISNGEVNVQVGEALARMSGRGLFIGRPQVIPSSGRMGLTVAAPVMNNEKNEEVIDAAVVAVVSFDDVLQADQVQSSSRSEQQLLDAGLPVVFIVDPQGRAVVHPEKEISVSKKPMNDLKVVQDWIETSAQVQSVLEPFTVERNGKKTDMLGSYATADLDTNGGDARLGVIAIQDEEAALKSVAEMRRQTLLISLLAATFALLIGYLFARGLTRPVSELAAGAKRIATGDFSQRIDVRTRTELGELGKTFNLMTDQIEDFIKDLRSAAEENRQLFLGTVKALAAAIDGKDPYTRGHSERVSRFSIAIAESLGLNDLEIEQLRVSALLHDVGKIGIDDRILKKPSPLTDEEYEIMKQHPQKGYKIMSQIPAMKDFLPGMYMHHEAIDGRGYPQGLKGDEIPMQARIISVADTFDALTTDRPYQIAMKMDAAVERIKTFIGTRYDPVVVDALVKACDSGSIRAGSVRLSPRTRAIAAGNRPPAVKDADESDPSQTPPTAPPEHVSVA